MNALRLKVVNAFLAHPDQEQITYDQAREHLSVQELAKAVTAGLVKSGVMGFWVPRPADPGFEAAVADALEQEEIVHVPDDEPHTVIFSHHGREMQVLDHEQSTRHRDGLVALGEKEGTYPRYADYTIPRRAR